MNIREFFAGEQEYLYTPYNDYSQNLVAKGKGEEQPSEAPYSCFEPLRFQGAKGDGDLSYFQPDHLGGSDYSGGVVNKANYRDFVQLFGDIPGVCTSWGGHGTYAVFIREDVDNEELIDCLRGLADYPLISDETLSALEQELTEEAWKNWARSDFAHGIAKKFLMGPDDTYPDDWEADDDTVRKIFYILAERANEYWEVDGESMFIDIDRIISVALLDDLDDETYAQALSFLTDAATGNEMAERRRAVRNPNQGKLPLY